MGTCSFSTPVILENNQEVI